MLTKKQKGLIQKWTDVLTSRKYKQGQGYLRQVGETKRSVDKFCCLGVLCDIIDPSEWESPGCVKSSLFCYRYKADEGTLPDAVLKKIGLSRAEEEILIEMNDEGSTFGKIAKYLEKTYLI